MCPDKELLSAYYDGEVPSPWKERIRQHLEECSSCTETLSSYRRIKESLREDIPEKLDQKGVQKRLGDFLRSRPSHPSPLWKRRISLSLTALGAAAVLVFITGVGLTLVLNRGRMSPMGLAAGSAKPLDMTIKVKDLKQLREILNRQEGLPNLTIQLPEARPYEFRGEPVFLRESEISRSLPR